MALSSIVRLALVLFDYPRCTVTHRPGSIIRPSLYFTCNNRNGWLNNGITGLNVLIAQELSRAYAIFKRDNSRQKWENSNFDINQIFNFVFYFGMDRRWIGLLQRKI